MTDLTDRMRTCAAHIVSMTGVKEGSDPDANQTLPSRLVADAADLLIEASNELEQLHSTGALRIPHDLGEPMEIIPPLDAPRTLHEVVDALAQKVVLPLPPDAPQHGRFEREHNPRACPRCDSRAGKRMHREGRKLMLTCPACLEEWQWKPRAEWV